jgi:hypothetical protein
MSINQADYSSYYYIFTILFCLALALLLWRFVVKPEQAWYQGRALAESVKTSAWRFCMRSAPFDDLRQADAVSDFQRHLRSILSANQYAGTRLPPNFAADNQVTDSMKNCRELPLSDRMRLYEEHRINDQRKWYAAKAGANKRAALFWVSFCVIAYCGAITLSLTRAAHPEITWLPTEVLITIAASIVGWMQIKKFNELSASYILTAHEISIMHGQFSLISEECKFAEFVNEAEQAFSREHTQWVARLS